MVLEGFEGFMLPLFDALIIKIPFFSFFGFETIVDVLWSVLVIRLLKRTRNYGPSGLRCSLRLRGDIINIT